MVNFRTDVWIVFSEEEVPLEKVERAERIATELGADDTLYYGALCVKYEGYDQEAVKPYAAAILSRLNESERERTMEEAGEPVQDTPE